MGPRRILALPSRQLLFLSLLGGLMIGCAPEVDSLRIVELRDRRQALVATFASIQSQIRPAQAEALDSPGVQEAQAAFYEVLRARMIQVDPNAEAMLDRARGLGAELENATQNVPIFQGDTTAATLEEKRAIASEFQELERALTPLEDEALKYPEVAGAFRALQDSVAAEIIRIDPNAEALLEQMKEIERELTEIDAELAELEV